jgi:transcriptional regulator with XRE-family HTH domain
MWEGERLKDIIRENNLTVTGVAKRLGVSRTAVNDWINGTVPSGLHLVKISRLLSVTPEDFFSMEATDISIPLHRKKGTAKIKEPYRSASQALAEEYKNMLRNALPPALVFSLRTVPHEREAQVALAMRLREASGIERNRPMDYEGVFRLLIQLGIVTVLRKFPKAIKGYAFYSLIHGHRVIFVNTATNVLDLIFPILHEVIHAIRHRDDEAVFDDKEEGYCDDIAGLVQFPEDYVDLLVTALREKSKAAKVKTLKDFSAQHSHSVWGIAEEIKKSGSRVLSGINVAGANTNLKKAFPTLEEFLFTPPDPRSYIQKLHSLSPIFLDIVKVQAGSASRRKVGEWLGLDNIADAKKAIEELSVLS